MHKSQLADIVYLVAMGVWLLWVVLRPYWSGTSYVVGGSTISPQTLTRTGTFGLTPENVPNSSIAPLRNPPRPTSTLISATVRWPWEIPSQPYHVEISLSRVSLRWGGGSVLLGMAFAIVMFLIPARQVSLVRIVANTLTASLFMASVAIFGIAFMSRGYGPPNEAIVVIIVAATAIGCVLGLIVFLIRWCYAKAAPVKSGN